MKKKFLFTLILALALCFAIAIVSSAATYYVDVNGKIQSSADENTAYEFDTTVNSGTCYVSRIFLHDTTIVDLVIPDFEEITLMRIASWGTELKVYSVENKNAEYTTDMELQKNIKSLDVYEKIYIEGANGNSGSFMNWAGLETVIFRGSFAYTTSSGGFTKH